MVKMHFLNYLVISEIIWMNSTQIISTDCLWGDQPQGRLDPLYNCKLRWEPRHHLRGLLSRPGNEIVYHWPSSSIKGLPLWVNVNSIFISACPTPLKCEQYHFRSGTFNSFTLGTSYVMNSITLRNWISH